MGTENINVLDFSDPTMSKALRLAQKLNDFCKINNLPRALILDGVAIDAGQVRAKAYHEGHKSGVSFEKGRMAGLLGLESHKDTIS